MVHVITMHNYYHYYNHYSPNFDKPTVINPSVGGGL